MCECIIVYHCHTEHRTVQITSSLTLQTIIIAQLMSAGGDGGLYYQLQQAVIELRAGCCDAGPRRRLVTDWQPALGQAGVGPGTEEV